MNKLSGYIGTYEDDGIYEFSFDETQACPLTIKPYLDVLGSSKYLSYDKALGLAYIAYHDGFGIGQYKHNKQSFAGNEQEASCYVLQDKDLIYTANYHEGSFSVYQSNPLQLLKKVVIQAHAGCHQVIVYEDCFWIPCLNLDVIKIYDAHTYEWIQDIQFPLGSGVRHGVIDEYRNCLYVLSEHSCELYTIDLQTKRIIEKVTLVEKEAIGGGAAIRLSKDHRYLYLSLRKSNSIVVFDIDKAKVIQRISSGGKHPRDIQLSPDGKYLFVANLMDDCLTIMQRDQASGYLTTLDIKGKVLKPVSIVFKEI